MIRLVICMVFMLVSAGFASGRSCTQAEKLHKKANAEYYSEHYPEALDLYIDALECAAKVLVFSYVIYNKNRHLSQTQRLLIAKNNDLEERDGQNRTLLKQYLEQLDRNRIRAAAVEVPATADSGTDAAADECENGYSRDDDAEKQLLSHINDVMSDMKAISSPDFSLQTLADMVGSNTSYVSRVINNSYHKNFKTLLNETRIREACHKLADRQQYEGYTMQVIYEAVGYRNASSFIRAFKKVYNMTPSEFQKLAAEGKENI